MRVTFEIIIRSDTDEILSFADAVACHGVMRNAARELSGQISLLSRGKVEAVAAISVEDGAKSFVNLGEVPNDKKEDRGVVRKSSL